MAGPAIPVFENEGQEGGQASGASSGGLSRLSVGDESESRKAD